MDAVHERGRRRRRRGTVSRLLKLRTAEKVESLPAVEYSSGEGAPRKLRYRDNSFVWNANRNFSLFPKKKFPLDKTSKKRCIYGAIRLGRIERDMVR